MQFGNNEKLRKMWKLLKLRFSAKPITADYVKGF